MSEEQLDLEADDEGVIHIGLESISVYSNLHGDICISQYCQLACGEVVIVIPVLYCDAVIREIKRAAKND